VDVKVRLTDGRQVIVEMQRRNHESWALRALYYPASSFTSTLGMHEAGASHIQNYVALCPTHGISVLDFTCFPGDSDALRTYVLYDKTHEQVYYEKPLGPLSLTFFELGKKPRQGQRHLAYWQMVFQGQDLPNDVPAYFTEAQAVVDRTNLTKEELVMIAEKEKAALDLASWLGYERREGFKEGEARGEARSKLEVARALLSQGVDPRIIAGATGLDSATLTKL
jgi:predicted transposase/invertase (TIGR01784 family)